MSKPSRFSAYFVAYIIIPIVGKFVNTYFDFFLAIDFDFFLAIDSTHKLSGAASMILAICLNVHPSTSFAVINASWNSTKFCPFLKPSHTLTAAGRSPYRVL